MVRFEQTRPVLKLVVEVEGWGGGRVRFEDLRMRSAMSYNVFVAVVE